MFVGDIIFYFYVLLGVGGGFSHLTPARSMKGNPKFNDMRDFAISFSYHYYIIHLFNSLIWGPDTRGTVFSFYLQFTPPPPHICTYPFPSPEHTRPHTFFKESTFSKNNNIIHTFFLEISISLSPILLIPISLPSSRSLFM